MIKGRSKFICTRKSLNKERISNKMQEYIDIIDKGNLITEEVKHNINIIVKDMSNKYKKVIFKKTFIYNNIIRYVFEVYYGKE